MTTPTGAAGLFYASPAPGLKSPRRGRICRCPALNKRKKLFSIKDLKAASGIAYSTHRGAHQFQFSRNPRTQELKEI